MAFSWWRVFEIVFGTLAVSGAASVLAFGVAVLIASMTGAGW